jgi:hypothetical protein
MHYQSGRLVDHREVLIFKNDSEWDCCRLDRAGRFLVGQSNVDPLAPAEKMGGSARLSVYRYTLVRN